jgi:hypothetical protein
MKKFFILGLFLIITFLISPSVAQATTTSDLRVSNSNGVMYITTESTAPTSTTTIYTATTSSPTYTPITGQNVNVPIVPPKGFATDIGNVINFVLRIIMVIAVLLVFFYLVLGGIEWITSGGEKGKTEAARNKIVAAVVGLLILAGSFAILTLVIRFLGFSDLNSVLNNVGTINNPVITTPASPSSSFGDINRQR